MTEKMLVFDMDGTIADLYADPRWINRLHEHDASLYENASPLYNMNLLNTILYMFKEEGWKIVVTSWLAGDSTPDFDSEVRQAKKDWLTKYQFPYDEIHLVKYGTTKADCTRKKGGFQILVDDNADIRKGWHLGETIDPTENLIDQLLQILSDSLQ